MLRLDFINVGSGDAILIRETGGEKPFTMLVDAGDSAPLDNANGTKRVYAADYLMREKVDHLDLFVVTHLHRDHLYGAEQVIQNVSVDRLLVNYLPGEAHRNAVLSADTPDGPLPKGIVNGLSTQMALVNALSARGTKVEAADHRIVGEALTPELAMDVTCCGRYLYARYRHELDKLVEGSADRYALKLMRAYLNLTSIRLVLTYHGKRVFLPSDAYATYWDVDAAGPCHILKVPHHGTQESVTPLLLDALKPEIAVISVSNDRDDRPDDEIVTLLKERVPKLCFTDAVTTCNTPPEYHEAVTLTIE